VTHDKAALATDGRYFNQAEKQLDTNWELLKQGLTDVPTWQEWYNMLVRLESGQPANSRRAVEQSEGGKTVGVDPAVITARKSSRCAIILSILLIHDRSRCSKALRKGKEERWL
jgi:Xaa-Pro aminopeptidase